jgi:CheY-like chemotaxis protein
LRENPAYTAIPLIALIAAALQETKEAADGLLKAYITKPIDFSELSQALQPHI